MDSVHLNWLTECGLTVAVILPFVYGRITDAIKRRTVGIDVLFPHTGKAQMTVYFWCSVTRKPSFTARATIVPQLGRPSSQVSTRSAAKQPGARQIAVPMIRMPFAGEPGYRTAGTIEIDRSDRRRRERVRVEILDGRGRAIRTRMRSINWNDAGSN